ncbi:MAG: fibronectin type III domain-containing protein [Bacteroidia bacterium]
MSASSITETSAQLTWQAVSGVSSYEVQYRLNGAGTWTGPVSSSGNSLTLNGLTSGNNYEWQVRSVCSGSTHGQMVCFFS